MSRSPTLPRRAVTATFALASAALLAGCVVAPIGSYPHGYAPGYSSEVVPVAPPPPQYEAIGVAPYPGWIWISGHWGWNVNRHVWIGGRWEAPRAGHRWVPPQWQQQGRSWRHAPGYWAR